MKKYSKEDRKILDQFQSETIRSSEETFARIFSENNEVKLFFINNNQAFTDGKNIVVDPTFLEIFKDSKLLREAEKYYGLPHYLSHNRWNALKFVTRALDLHECLHLIYSRFPLLSQGDPRIKSRNGREVLHLITNLIEDVYITEVGSLCYDNIGVFLEVLEFCVLNSSSNTQSSSEELGERISSGSNKAYNLILYLNYMALFINPLDLKLKEPPEIIKEYVEKTKDLFKKGVKAPTPESRYRYSQEIFDIIKDLIPEDQEEELDLSPIMDQFVFDPINENVEVRDGKEQIIPYRHIEVDVDGTAVIVDLTETGTSLKEQLATAINEFNQEKRLLGINGSETDGQEIINFVIDLNFSKDAFNHQGIKVEEIRPRPEPNLKRLYNNQVGKFRSIINRYSSLFQNLLKEKVESREDGFTFGSGISSTRLGDPKRRYWYRNVEGINPPDLEVLILIDGSGSMYGKRIENTKTAAIILEEVLERSGIRHSIIEHRSNGIRPEVEIKILKDFNSGNNDKYNLLEVEAQGDNRDGLALLWCENYFRKSMAEDKLMIVISDGLPNHAYDKYSPPASVKDTKTIVSKIMRRGIKIVAVALDDQDDFKCYELLKHIYPNIISCNKPENLSRQLLEVIRKEILSQ